MESPSTPINSQPGLTPEELQTFRRLSEKQQAAQREKAKEQQFTTAEEVERIQKIMDENKCWVKTNSKDKTKHRVVHVFPNFHGPSEEGYVNRGTADKPDLAINARYMAVVEAYEERQGPDKKVLKTPLSSFNIDALKFLEDFELA